MEACLDPQLDPIPHVPFPDILDYESYVKQHTQLNYSWTRLQQRTNLHRFVQVDPLQKINKTKKRKLK